MSAIYLKKRTDFLKVSKNGKKVFTKGFIIQKYKRTLPLEQNTPRIGFTITKKIGGAVIRNKIKRKLKTAVQKIITEKGQIDLNYTYVIFGKNNVYKDKFGNILNEVSETFEKIKQIN